MEEAIAEEAVRRHPGLEIDLEVHAWNTRAIKVYKSAGFTITDTYERPIHDRIETFHCMVYQRNEHR